MMMKKAGEVDEEADLREAFKIFDRDKDGFISMTELKKVAISITALQLPCTTLIRTNIFRVS